jgi:hypothetical protein
MMGRNKMSLEILDKIKYIEKPNQHGYKVLIRNDDGELVCSDHVKYMGKVVYPMGKWFTDPNHGKCELGISDKTYPQGLHIMLDIESAERISHNFDDVLVEVEFKKVVASQTESPSHLYGRVVVARQAKVTKILREGCRTSPHW